MKSITIHDLDDELDHKIRTIASRDGLSLNKTIKKILRSALGLEPHCKLARRGEFQDLFGTWSKKELSEFQKKTADFSKVDPADWQ
jgi:plasmid stability protein